MTYIDGANGTMVTLNGAGIGTEAYIAPCYQQQHWFTTSTCETEHFDFKFRKVENGFILKHNYKEYIVKSIAELTKLMEKLSI